MAIGVSECLQTLSRATGKPEAEIISLALQTGLGRMWREHCLGRYLRGEMPREEAVSAVGTDWVELAERQCQAMNEDLAWAMRDP